MYYTSYSILVKDSETIYYTCVCVGCVLYILVYDNYQLYDVYDIT